MSSKVLIPNDLSSVNVLRRTLNDIVNKLASIEKADLSSTASLADVIALQTDVATLQTDVATLQTDLAALEANLATFTFNTNDGIVANLSLT